MKKIICILIIFLFPLFPGVPATKKLNREIIFVIDISASMQKDGVFNKLKKDIKEYVKKELSVGDEVSVLTFGTKVAIDSGNYIGNTQDIERLLRKITELEANEKYTYMSKAIDEMALLMKRINNSNKELPVIAFLFTDGLNDPPPSAGVEPIALETIIKKHFKTFKNPSNFIYIFTLGSNVERGLKKLAKEVKQVHIKKISEVNRVNIAKSKENMISKIKTLSFKPVNFNFTVNRSGIVKQKFDFFLVNIQGLDNVNVFFNTKNPYAFNKKFSIKFGKRKKKYSVSLQFEFKELPQKKLAVIYRVFVQDKIEVYPEKIYINFIFKQPSLTLYTHNADIRFPVHTQKLSIKIRGKLNGKNKTVFYLYPNPDIPNIKLVKNKFEVDKGDFEISVPLICKFSKPGEHFFRIKIKPDDKSLKVENNFVNVKMKFYKPIYLTKSFMIFVIFLLIFFLLFLFLRSVNKRFSEWQIEGFGIEETLNTFRSWYSLSVVVGVDVFEDIFDEQILKIFIPFKNLFFGDLYVEALIDKLEVIDGIDNDIGNGSLFKVPISDMRFKIDDKTFSIKSNYGGR